MSIIAVIAALMLLSGCGHKVQTRLPTGPPQDELLYREGLDAFRQGTPEGFEHAAIAFRKASALKPAQCEYALNLVQSLLFLAIEQRANREDFRPRQSEAEGILDSVATRCASDEPFVLRARALITGRGPQASAMVNRALDLDSSDAMNWLIHGKVDPAGRFDQTGRQVIAKVQATQLDPDSALIQFEAGDYLIVREPEKAKAAFQRTIALSPRHFKAYLGLAYSASVDETIDVEPYYRKVVELAPNFLDGRMALGNYYASLDEIDQAGEQYNGALAANPGFDPAHFRLGLLALYVEKPDEAEFHFKAAARLNPDGYESYYYLGNIYRVRGDLDQAQAQYEQALKYRINYIEPMYGLGLVFGAQGKIDLALAQFEKVIAIVPQYATAYTSRAAIRAQRSQLTEAISDFQRAIGLYEQQLKQLDSRIAFADAHPQSRAAQVDRKRAEKDKEDTQRLMKSAQLYKAAIEEDIRTR
jgi:tetratricopeptide (TPR) repeat protein